MRIIDAQHHEPSIWQDWTDLDESKHGRLFMEIELAAMNAIGVSGVVLHPSSRKWAEEAATLMPGRFAVVANYPRAVLEAASDDIATTIANEKRNPAVLGVRLVLNSGSPRWETPKTKAVPITQSVSHDLREGVAYFESGGYDKFLSACEQEELPVFMFAPTRLDLVKAVAERYPKLTLIVDHLGFSQPPVADRDDPPFRFMSDLLALAEFPGVALKLCGVPALSGKPYPYPDVWTHLSRLVGEFGAERMMWASDISRVMGRTGLSTRNPYGETDYPGKHNYAESLRYILDSDQLSRSQKESILGGTVRTLLGWGAES